MIQFDVVELLPYDGFERLLAEPRQIDHGGI